MYKFDFVPPLLDFVRGKVKSFLVNHELGDIYPGIEQSAHDNKVSDTDYVNRLLNDTVSKVANHEGKDWNEIRDEFTVHYLKGV